jgi:hypothetical protein
MWARLDDALIDHPKIFAAGGGLGKNGPALALSLYTIGLMWSNKHLTDGHLPMHTVKAFPHLEHPLIVADALIKAGLWSKNGDGFLIHDFDDFNPSAADVKKRRREDRRRKREERK